MKNSLVQCIQEDTLGKKKNHVWWSKGSRNSKYNYFGSLIYSLNMYWIRTSCQVWFEVLEQVNDMRGLHSDVGRKKRDEETS